MGDYKTQGVTMKDIEAGQIRLPITNNAKSLFPSAPGEVLTRLRGHSMTVHYDPRHAPDRERSGVLRIGTTVMATGIIEPDERLTMTPGNPVSID